MRHTFGGWASLLLDLLRGEPLRGLNAVIRVEGHLLLLNWFKEGLTSMCGLRAHGRLSGDFLSESFNLFDF